MTGNSEKFSSEKEREREISSWSHLPVTHFLVYRETQHNSVTHKKDSERDSEHSQTLRESPASFYSAGKLWN